MKAINTLMMVGTALIFSQCSLTYDGPNVTVCQWPNDCTAAISYTFDDNCPNQFSTVVPMLNEFEVKGTFFPVIDWLKGDYTNIKEAAAYGHEIGSHTVSHPNLRELSDEDAQREMYESRATIEDVIGNDYKCVTIAYPYCQAPQNIQLVADNFIVARVCDGKVDSVGIDFMRASAHPLGGQFNATTFEGLKFIFEKTRAKGGWSSLLFHEIDEGNGYSPFPSAEIRKSLEYLKENESIYWVNTMGNVARYIMEREHLKMEVSLLDGDYYVNVVLDGLDEVIYNLPLTFRYTKKDGSVAHVDIMPDGQSVKLDI